MGAAMGRSDTRHNYWWLGAGLALGAQVVLSLPLVDIAPANLAEYRAYLSHAQPFAGDTRLGPGLHPDTFATTVRGTTFLGVLNREGTTREIGVDLRELGLAPDARYLAYEAEHDRYFAVRGSFATSLPPESFSLFVLRREPGVMWTTSSYQPLAGGGCLRLTVGGPPAVDGFLQAFVPSVRAVYLDGRPLAASPAGAEGYQYDPSLGVLTVRYPHAAARDLRVEC
jgi:hypothetical protein